MRDRHINFWLTGARHYRNADKVVHLYNYLLAGAAAAVAQSRRAALIDTHAVADADLIGPFQVLPADARAADGHSWSTRTDMPWIRSSRDRFLHSSSTGLIGRDIDRETPADLHGRVLTGVALDRAAQRFTPVALAIPTETAIEFDISWEADDL